MSVPLVPAELAEPVEPGNSALPTVGERRGHRLAPLQTNFSRPTAAQLNAHTSRLQRPRPPDPTRNGPDGPVPLQNGPESPVKRQSSKTSLRSLFGRDKTARAATAPDAKLAEIEETQPVAEGAAAADAPLSPSLTSPRTVPSASGLASPTTPRPRTMLKTARARPGDTKTPSQEQYGWKPPPLFQAYPQSTKHGCLSAPAMSADSILRLHATTAKGAAEDGRSGGLGQDEVKKREQRERRHLRTLSGTINKVEWIKKIYVLANVGYILQYAGEGKHDRLPEKMLQLGPHSVAFASDAIPGKHWVVQVSQDPAADAGPAPAEPPKPRLGRFGFHRTHTRRLARSFLLVFDNPDSMTSWLAAIRTEIEARGGPKYNTEKASDDDSEPQLRSKSSVRQTVKRDPHRISSLFLQPQTLRSPDEEDGQSIGGLTWQSRRSSYVSVNRRSMADSRSGSVSTGWTEATAPTNGSDGPSSFASPNIPGSPPRAKGTTRADEHVLRELDQSYTRSPPSSSHGKRQSLYGSPKTQPIPIAGRTEAPQPSQHPPSIPETLVRSASPPAPNFSVPSFSKKFVSRQGPTPTTQGSSPPSVAGVLRWGESIGDFSISSISSPPQSPTYSIASSRQTDSSELPVVTRDATGRRILRPSNSEDALSRTVRPTQNAPNFSRVPLPSAPSETSSPSSRPVSLVGRAGLGIQMYSEPQVQNTPPVEAIPRNRVPALHSDNQSAQNMSRRKSMPGLSVGPPAAPPPNCPLPKIPSSLAAQPPPLWSTSPPTDRFYQSDQIRGHIQEKRKSGIPKSTNGSRTAARQSRIIQ
ncbi:uncharacterized protein N7459_008878 [Penicillium hispanicum]|uniref:uncharacterized protein n=1 Tax=Penicillium hispanicum TaxID=1080232 RepID=UPI0025419E20|nr:uncharacterized protein N7459_008878 [Penicillium hispanicum]KAJ5569448.1 hypothetical protein N7459_008878 [Penicillium hispanicum]